MSELQVENREEALEALKKVYNDVSAFTWMSQRNRCDRTKYYSNIEYLLYSISKLAQACGLHDEDKNLYNCSKEQLSMQQSLKGIDTDAKADLLTKRKQCCRNYYGCTKSECRDLQ